MIHVEDGLLQEVLCLYAALDLTENIYIPINPQLHHLFLNELGITDIQACKAALSDPYALTYDQVLLDPDIEECNHTAAKQRHMG